MGPIRYGGYHPPRESFVRLKVGGEDEDGDDGDDGDGGDFAFGIESSITQIDCLQNTINQASWSRPMAKNSDS